MKVNEIWSGHEGQDGAGGWAMVGATHEIEQKRDEKHLEHLLALLRRYCHGCLCHGRWILDLGLMRLSLHSSGALLDQNALLLVFCKKTGVYMPREGGDHRLLVH